MSPPNFAKSYKKSYVILDIDGFRLIFTRPLTQSDN